MYTYIQTNIYGKYKTHINIKTCTLPTSMLIGQRAHEYFETWKTSSINHLIICK